MKNKKTLYLSLIISFALIVFFVGISYSLPDVDNIKEITINTENYNEPGSWQIKSSSKWIGLGEVETTLDFTSVEKRNTTRKKDVVIVLNLNVANSTARDDLVTVVEELLSVDGNRAALITFTTTGTIVSQFTDDDFVITRQIRLLNPSNASRSYNDGLLKVDELLTGYEQRENTDLVVMFITNGKPDRNSPTEVATYGILKDKYPFLHVHAIQYNYQNYIVNEIKNISDRSALSSPTELKEVFRDMLETITDYESFEINDYINTDYYTIDSINNISTNKGTVSLENNNSKIRWNLGKLRTGSSARMRVKLKLKDEYKNVNGLYKVNNQIDVNYKIEDQPLTNKNTLNSTVLRNGYTVTYKPNLPPSCNLSLGNTSEQHFVFENITKIDESYACNGYSFRGYDFLESDAHDVTIINDDMFVMPWHDVELNGLWTKEGLVKSMDGTIKQNEDGVLMLQDEYLEDSVFGKAINKASFETITIVDNVIVPSTAIDSWDASAEQNNSIIAWYTDIDDDGLFELYIGQEGGVKANPNSEAAFYAYDYVTTVDVRKLNISQVTDMTGMFYYTGYEAPTFRIIGLDDWDVSNVTDMKWMFESSGELANSYDIGDLSSWNVGNVTDMQFMFSSAGDSARVFDIGDLDDWNVSKVTNMNYMFSAGYTAETFNIGNLDNWDVSSLTTMKRIFYYAGYTTKNWSVGDLSGWGPKLGNVTDMSGVFEQAGFNSTNWDVGDLDSWDLSSVKTVATMFYYAGRNSETWNAGDLSEWDVSKVTTFSNMFGGAAHVATEWSIGDISGWDVSSATSLAYMFDGTATYAESFNLGNLHSWGPKLNKVTSMTFLFNHSGVYSSEWYVGDLSNWDLSNVKNTSYMFNIAGNSASEWSIGDISGWDVSNVTNMYYMFCGTGHEEPNYSLGNIGLWADKVSKVENFGYMFYEAGYNSETFYIGDLSNWDTSSATSMLGMFYRAGYSAEVFNIGDLGDWDLSSVTSIGSMFAASGHDAGELYVGDLSGWDVSHVSNFSDVFHSAGTKSENINVGNLGSWVVSSGTSMQSMFSNFGSNSRNECYFGDISGWQVGSVKDFSYMFNSVCQNNSNFVPSDLSEWDVSNAERLQYMFIYAGYSIPNFSFGDLSGWDTHNALDMESMFAYSGYNSQTWYVGDLSEWDLSNVINTNSMFYYAGYKASEFDIGNIKKWNVSHVIDMSKMFAFSGMQASKWYIGDLSCWDTSLTANMSSMFQNAGLIATNWGDIGTLKVHATNISNMFASANRAKATLKLYNVPTTYENALYDAANVEGSSILVKYVSTVTNINNIMATASQTSNITSELIEEDVDACIPDPVDPNDLGNQEPEDSDDSGNQGP